jgi:hypothetical protein
VAGAVAMHTAIKLLFCLILPCLCYAKDFAYFTPPKDWNPINPTKLSSRIKFGFVGKPQNSFCPSINLAVENVNISLEAYVQAVKKIHEADPSNHWRDLGKFSTGAGQGQLTEITSDTPTGQIRLLQMILVKNQKAYVMTASALKQFFSKFYRDFNAAFQSFTITSDLLQALPQAEMKEGLVKRKQQLKTALADGKFLDDKFQKDHWQPFQTSFLEDYKQMGPCWQMLTLIDLQEQLME